MEDFFGLVGDLGKGKPEDAGVGLGSATLVGENGKVEDFGKAYLLRDSYCRWR